MNNKIITFALVFSVFLAFSCGSASAQFPPAENDLDRQVISFLKEQTNQWRYLNVPMSDGRILYDLVLKGNYKKAVEIGTSTGHSGIWIAWALSKTGGKLITIEIDKGRHEEAVANFKQAGVAEFIDARLGNAHDLVPALEGTYDFVFSDADKNWYKNYFTAMAPKLVKGGCFTAHNTNMRSGDMREFLHYVENHQDFTTTHHPDSRSGISISYKK